MLQSFIDKLHSTHVTVELGKNKPATVDSALESAMHFDPNYGLEARKNEACSPLLSINSITVYSRKVYRLVAGQVSHHQRSHLVTSNLGLNCPFQYKNFLFTKCKQDKFLSSPLQFKERRKSSSPRQAFVNNCNSRSNSSEQRVMFTVPTVSYRRNRKSLAERFVQIVGTLVHRNINVINISKCNFNSSKHYFFHH